MHIQPGQLAGSTILGANLVAASVLVSQAPALLRRPALWLRTLLAAGFFSLLMQSWHMQAGASELHLIGAMPIYLLFGFLPSLFGFALGLLMQGLLFEPQDLIHLGVNALSLMLPLIALHASIGPRLAAAARERSVAAVLRMDAAYYGGVTLMVGFWLSQGLEATPFQAWLHFALSYVLLLLFEPLVTWALVSLLARREGAAPAWLTLCLDESLTRRSAA